MYRSYSQDMLSAETPAEVIAVARTVLADLRSYHRAECDGAAAGTPRQRARTQSRAFNAAGEMHLVLQSYFSGADAQVDASELDYFKVLLACVLAADVNNDKTSGAAQWATAKLWSQQSPSLRRYLAALALAAHDAPDDTPRTLLHAVGVVDAAEAALLGRGDMPIARPMAPSRRAAA